MQNKNHLAESLRELSDSIERDIAEKTTKLTEVKRFMDVMGISVPCEDAAANGAEAGAAPAKTKPRTKSKTKKTTAERDPKTPTPPVPGTQPAKVLRVLERKRGTFVPAEEIADKAKLGPKERVSPVISALRKRGYSIDNADALRDRGADVPSDASGYLLP